jgi:hypothetical protein
MRPVLVAVIGLLLAGCLGERVDIGGMDVTTAPATLEPGWRLELPDGEASYDGAALVIAAETDSVAFTFTVENGVTFDPFRISFQGLFTEEAHVGEHLFSFTVWDRVKGERFTHYWYLDHGVWASVSAAGQNVLTVRNVQDGVLEGPRGFYLNLETGEPWSWPAGDYGILIGGAPLKSLKVAFDVPAGVAGVANMVSQSGCKIIPPSEFDAALQIWAIAGPTVILDAEYRFEVAHGVAAFMNIDNWLGLRSVEIIHPDGFAVKQEGVVHEDPLAYEQSLWAFQTSQPGTYVARVNHVADVHLNSFFLAYCGVPRLGV